MVDHMRFSATWFRHGSTTGCLIYRCTTHQHVNNKTFQKDKFISNLKKISFSSHGFPNNLETFGLISGLWTSTFALGAFIGPSVSGILYDNIGFRNASMFVFVIHLLVGIAVTIFLFCERKSVGYVELKDTTKLPNGEISGSMAKSTQNSATESMNR